MNFKQVLLNGKWNFDPKPLVTIVNVGALQVLWIDKMTSNFCM